MKSVLAVAISMALFAPALAVAQQGMPEQKQDEVANQKKSKDKDKPLLMPTIDVIGQRLFPYQEGISIDEQYVQSQAKGNGDISTLLRINPNVQFSDSEQTSLNMGEIRPAKISINGGMFNQNSFLLDGVSFNNDLDPTARDNPHDTVNISSDAQGIAVDTDLIGSLTVYDSNVPASFGGFNGGVVDVETRKAGHAFSGKASWRASRSVWNEYHLREGQLESFLNSNSQAQQPEYDKQKLSLMLENRFANGLGLIGNISRLRSEIPLNGYANGFVPPQGSDQARKDNIRENTSYSLRADYTTSSGVALSGAINYAPTDETYFIVNTKDSFFDLKRGGYAASFNVRHDLGAWRLKHGLSHAVTSSSRDSRGINIWRTWARSADKNWGRSNQSLEGNWGSVDQDSRTTRYSLDFSREALRWGNAEHRLQWGLSASSRNGSYHRLNDHYAYIRVGATTTCTDANGVVDSENCSLGAVPGRYSRIDFNGKGQYFTQMVLRRAGYFEADADDYSLYFQDDIRLGNVSLRPGIRFDYDNISKQVTTSPRFAASWDVLGNQQTLLTAGLNRYYGRNFYIYKLREGREALESQYKRSNTGSHAWQWREDSRAISSNTFRDIKVPYSDEWTLGLNQRWAGFDFNLKVVDRNNQDEVMRVRERSATGQNIRRYANVAGGRARVWSFSLSPVQALEWGNTRTNLMLALDKTHVRRQYSAAGNDDYDSNFDEAWLSGTVRYNGQLMSRRDMDASDFARPWTARLSTQTVFGESGLSLGNFLRYRSGYARPFRTDVEVLGSGERVDVYQRISQPRTFTWDASLQYELPLGAQYRPYIRLEAMNLLNRANVATATATNVLSFEPGRSYWLELGVKF